MTMPQGLWNTSQMWNGTAGSKNSKDLMGLESKDTSMNPSKISQNWSAKLHFDGMIRPGILTLLHTYCHPSELHGCL